MNTSEIILTCAGVAISTLIAIVGYLTNRQLQRVDDKVTIMDNGFFELKSKVVQLATTDKLAIIEHLQKEIMPYLRDKKLPEQVATLTTQINDLQEYQKRKISPALDTSVNLLKTVQAQEARQKESDIVLHKMFEVVKRLIEKSNVKNG